MSSSYSSSSSSSAQAQAQQLHFVLFPMMAQGHMMPMVDMSQLIAKQGAIVTIVTTPANVPRFRSTVDRARDEAGLDIRVLQLRFPSKEVGLPEGCENCDTIPSHNLSINFMTGVEMLKDQLQQSLDEMDPPPDCIISDFAFHWTTQLATKLTIPRIIFHGTGCFSLFCSHNLHKHKLMMAGCASNNNNNISACVLVPGVPDRIQVPKAWLPDPQGSGNPGMTELRKKIRAAEEDSFGVVVNSFDELESDYVRGYKAAKEGKVWCIGPVSSLHKEETRGPAPAVDEKQCLQWLDSFDEDGSVVYACMGSVHSLPCSQQVELGLGLEASNRPFIWVLRGAPAPHSEEVERWLEGDGFEERVKGRGLVIKGWAPQLLILSHPAVGVFLTHCGWNSTLEAVAAGVLMVTWPMFLEQFLNQTLVVQVLKIGVRVGVEAPVKWGEEEKENNVVLVKKEDVRKALEMVMMDEGGEVEEARRRARKLRDMASRAIREGGSSQMNLKSLIQEIAKHKADKQASLIQEGN